MRWVLLLTAAAIAGCAPEPATIEIEGRAVDRCLAVGIGFRDTVEDALASADRVVITNGWTAIEYEHATRGRERLVVSDYLLCWQAMPEAE